jgi:hypothetical protein
MDLLNLGEVLGAQMNASTKGDEISFVHGHYDVACRDAEGNMLWTDSFDNLVTIGGKTSLLASGVTGTAYMGLISASGFTAVSGTDTIGSHSGWQEAGQGAYGPTYGATRPQVNWGAPANGSISNAGSVSTFVFTGSGTVEGAFVANLGASSAVGNTTAGSLLSAGTLTTPQPVINGNTITMAYTLNLS